jgi:hypothetical protein
VQASVELDQDDSGWYAATVIIEGRGQLHLERFLAEEDGIRGELNSWAAWVEASVSPTRQRGTNLTRAVLMERMIQAQQFITLTSNEPPEEQATMERLCLQLCRFLAQKTEGTWQADGEGLFAADGALLVGEEG